jgi:glycosyl transferase family 25
MKAYVIYLSGDEFSVKMTKDAVASLEKFNIEYELFDGVLGREGINVLKSFGAKPSVHVNQREWTNGTIGCLASHYVLWDKCSKQNEPFLIIEQDGVVIRDPRELLPDIKKVCHLDAYLPFENIIKTEGYNHFDVYNSNLENYMPGISRHPNNVFYNNSNKTGSTFRGTYGYIITPDGAKDILNFIANHGAFPSDRCLCVNATHLQKANSSYVRLNPFFENLNIQRKYSSR